MDSVPEALGRPAPLLRPLPRGFRLERPGQEHHYLHPGAGQQLRLLTRRARAGFPRRVHLTGLTYPSDHRCHRSKGATGGPLQQRVLVLLHPSVQERPLLLRRR